MSRRLVITFLSFFLIAPILYAHKPAEFPPLQWNERTQLYRNNVYTDHTLVFDYLFFKEPISSFLEFGLGITTQFFLENCESVTSVEISLPCQKTDWYDQCIEDFKDYENWNPILYRASEKLEKANFIAKNESRDPALRDGSYLLEIKDLCDDLFAEKDYDVAFVDQGIHPRGDIVNELFGRVPIIVAHDTSYGHEVYGWHKINTPADYVRIDNKIGLGVVFWIHESKRDLIQSLIPDYTFTIPKKYRIFFPDIHLDLTKSMALLCHYLGHTLVLPGKSFSPDFKNVGPKIRYGAHTGKLPYKEREWPEFLKENIEIIENDRILQNPPDIFFINCDLLQYDMINIYEQIKDRGIKLAHYSGNESVPYDHNYVRNLLASDTSTARHFNLHQLHYAFWIPWIDWESLKFLGINDYQIMPSYLHFNYNLPIFRPAKLLYDSYTRQYPKDSLLFTQPAHLDQEELFACMDNSIATMHIKNYEGFGYLIIQSLAKGRPVFLKRSFSDGKKLMNWCIEGETAFFFDTFEEFKEKIDHYLKRIFRYISFFNSCSSLV